MSPLQDFVLWLFFFFLQSHKASKGQLVGSESLNLEANQVEIEFCHNEFTIHHNDSYVHLYVECI